MTEFPKKITDDPYGAAILIRRLIMEQGAAYWRRYLVAFLLMGVSAGATAGRDESSSAGVAPLSSDAPTQSPAQILVPLTVPTSLQPIGVPGFA